jgi:Tol biopolymer transport system component
VPEANATTTLPIATTSSATASSFPQARLVFEWYAGRQVKDVVLVYADGSGQRPIATDVATNLEHADASWTPNGQSVVFDAGGWYEGVSIWEVPVIGLGAKPAKQLLGADARCRLGVGFPSYAPDGRRLLYVCQDGTTGTSADVHETLEILDTATGARTSVVTLRGHEELIGPSWSNDGTEAVFTVNYWSEDLTTQVGSAIATVPIGGGDIKLLTQRDEWATTPRWSPTGDVIAYATHGYGEMSLVSTIATIHPDGTAKATLWPGTDATVGRLGVPWWTPDGVGLIVSIATGSNVIEDIHAGTLSIDGTLGVLAQGISGVGFTQQP